MRTFATSRRALLTARALLGLAAMASGVAACVERSETGSGETAAVGDAGPDSDGSSAARPVPYPELLPALATGMYWDVAAHYTGNFSGVGFYDRRAVRLVLEAPRPLEGHEAFPVTQSLLWAAGNDQAPWSFQYSHLAVDATRLWGRFADGSGWTILVDTHGTWTGDDALLPSGEAVRGLAPRAMETVFVDDPGTLGAYQFTDAANCTFEPGIGQTICDDGSSNQVSAAEHITLYKARVGFYGHVQNNIISGGSGALQLAVVAHGTGATPCGMQGPTASVCGAATRRCMAACDTFACALDCTAADPEPACLSCARTRAADCAATPAAARGQRCCVETLDRPVDGCPEVWWILDENAACLSPALLGPCAGFDTPAPADCPAERPVRCERRGLSDCFASDVNCASVVDCAGVGGLGVVGCTGPNRAVECVTGSCLPTVDDEGSEAACDDGLDNDQDGFLDCRDFGCSANPLVGACGAIEVDNARCSNGLDDDDNGYADCEDFYCRVSPSVSVCNEENTPELCSNGVDDDGDDRADCNDPSCAGSGFVRCE